MGYLNKQTITVDAILTKKGRELLAQGRSAFQITQFAVADDEIDYGLYDVAHPLGTEYYGWAIENMPIVEASPDETQSLRYKLVSLNRGTNTIPTIEIGQFVNGLTLTYRSDTPVVQVLTPRTTNSLDQSPFGYTVTVYDANALTVTPSPAIPGTPTTPVFLGDRVGNNSIVVRGLAFNISPKDVLTVTNTQITIVGNQTGATVTIPVTVNPDPTRNI